MALIQHKNIQVRFDQQVENSANYVLPFLEKTCAIEKGTTVMEVGCAEGGVLLPFLEKGCTCVGVDLASIRIETSKEFLAEYVEVAKEGKSADGVVGENKALKAQFSKLS
mgnify:CR=1 FL=1